MQKNAEKMGHFEFSFHRFDFPNYQNTCNYLKWLNPQTSIPRDDIHVYNMIRLISLPNLVQRNPAQHQLFCSPPQRPRNLNQIPTHLQSSEIGLGHLGYLRCQRCDFSKQVPKWRFNPHGRIRKKNAKPNKLKISRVNNPSETLKLYFLPS